MGTLLHLLEEYGIVVVFVNVLLEQLGMPIPAYPTLLVSGAMAVRGGPSSQVLLAVAVTASLIADCAWYLAGRRYGGKIMSTLCRISLSPGTCMGKADALYTRWGPASLLISKFIPGLSTLGSALAGSAKTHPAVFVGADVLGALLWAGSALLLGTLFDSAVGDLLRALERIGVVGLVVSSVGIAVFLAYKWQRRHRFLRSLRMARISVADLHQLIRHDAAHVIIDARSAVSQRSGTIPGALAISQERLATFVLDVPLDRELILYCACPDEVSAAIVAKQLIDKGFRRVRPLAGGIEAWIAAGLAVEHGAEPAPSSVIPPAKSGHGG